MPNYRGHELEDYHDAVMRKHGRAISIGDLLPGMMNDHDILRIEESLANSNKFPSYIPNGDFVMQNANGTFPYMAGMDGPSQV